MSQEHSSDSATSATSATDLTNDEVRILVSQHMLFESAIHVNKRKVSVALLSPPPSDTSSSSSSSPSPSVVALEFVGFTTDAANEIFTKFVNKPPTSPDDLLNFAYGHISRLNRSEVQDMAIGAALSMVGIKPELRAVFLNPRFTQVRDTQTLHYWLKDTIATNTFTLMELQHRLKESAKLGPTKKQPKRGKLTSSTFEPATPPFSPTATLSQAPESQSFPTTHTAVETATPAQLPGHTVLYKGKSADEMSGSWIEDDGSLHMDAIASATNGDFNGEEKAFYFSPKRETAELYREWAQARCTYTESWNIRIELSDDYVTSLSREDLWWGADFKEYVWTCRKGMPVPNKPNFLRYKSADLLVGHIGRCPQLARLKRDNVQTGFTEDKLVWINEGSAKGTQWVFRYRQGEALAREAKGRIHIEVFAPLEQQDTEEA